MTLIEFYLNNPVVVLVMLMIAIGGVLGLATGLICDIREKKKKHCEYGEMTFREFTAWCKERVRDRRWDYNTIINCIKAMNDVELSPPWAREAAWRRINKERNIVECFVKPTNKKIEESLRADDDARPFKCNNGKIYMLPKDHCAFCDNCTDIYYDYSGPYLFLCNKGCEDYETCGSFEEEDDEKGVD